jgi:hypothetical protein
MTECYSTFQRASQLAAVWGVKTKFAPREIPICRWNESVETLHRLMREPTPEGEAPALDALAVAGFTVRPGANPG